MNRKDQIVLRFKMFPLVAHHASEQERMLKWCSLKNMEMVREMSSDSILVRFKRDKNTYEFIKEFLESKVQHALPFDSLTSIQGVEIVKTDE